MTKRDRQTDSKTGIQKDERDDCPHLVEPPSEGDNIRSQNVFLLSVPGTASKLL